MQGPARQVAVCAQAQIHGGKEVPQARTSRKALQASQYLTFHLDLVTRWACGLCRDRLLVLMVPGGVHSSHSTIAQRPCSLQCPGRRRSVRNAALIAPSAARWPWTTRGPPRARAHVRVAGRGARLRELCAERRAQGSGRSGRYERSDARELLLANQPVPHRVTAQLGESIDEDPHTAQRSGRSEVQPRRALPPAHKKSCLTDVRRRFL